ncbi:MAG: sulfotransferase [Candidatus Omnitrophota bacterium]
MDPIFIVGTERSGTNLLRLILNSHPHIAVPHPPHIMKNFSRLEPLYSDLSKDVNFKRLIKDVATSVRLHPYPWGFEIDEEKIFLNARERDLIHIYFAVYDQYLEHAGKERWACKSTFMIHHIELIRRNYPSAKFIYMVRDGRDVAASAKKSIFSHYSVYFTAQLWAKEQQLGIRWLNTLRKDAMLLVRYEDLLRQSRETVAAICSFLGEPFEEGMLRFFDTEEARKSGRLSAAWQNTSSPILKDNFEKYKKELRKDEIELFEAIAGLELSRFSYALTTPPCSSEEARAKKTRFKGVYLIEEMFLMLIVQVRHLFTDRNNFLRFRKFVFLKSLKLRALK